MRKKPVQIFPFPIPAVTDPQTVKQSRVLEYSISGYKREVNACTATFLFLSEFRINQLLSTTLLFFVYCQILLSQENLWRKSYSLSICRIYYSAVA